jgi:hypothetical protein
VRSATENGEDLSSLPVPEKTGTLSSCLIFVLTRERTGFLGGFFFSGLASPVCDSYVRPETLVRICDECNFGTYGGRCIICGSPGEQGFLFSFSRALMLHDSNPQPFPISPLSCSAPSYLAVVSLIICSHTCVFSLRVPLRDLGRVLLCRVYTFGERS